MLQVRKLMISFVKLYHTLYVYVAIEIRFNVVSGHFKYVVNYSEIKSIKKIWDEMFYYLNWHFWWHTFDRISDFIHMNHYKQMYINKNIQSRH